MYTDRDMLGRPFDDMVLALEEGSRADDEETLIEDHRAALRPAERVEQKLVEVLQSTPMLMSHLQASVRPQRR